METHAGIAVAVLNADDDVNAGAVASELLLGHLGVVLLRLDELMVQVQVV